MEQLGQRIFLAPVLHEDSKHGAQETRAVGAVMTVDEKRSVSGTLQGAHDFDDVIVGDMPRQHSNASQAQ
ncbi:MAG TPA: hypothetical protein VGO61_11950 [Steroidobacteraceae bacterium]|nr:hypothetical protein [Steroidobacteraceae bacterium]